MTALYQQHDLEFQFPENWELREGDADRMPVEITIESPQGSLWILSVFPRDSDESGLAKNVLDTLKEQYDSFEASSVEEPIGQLTVKGFNCNFFYLDLLIEAHIRHFSTHDRTFVLLYQAEDRVFQSEKLVLSAISTSLTNGL